MLRGIYSNILLNLSIGSQTLSDLFFLKLIFLSQTKNNFLNFVLKTKRARPYSK